MTGVNAVTNMVVGDSLQGEKGTKIGAEFKILVGEQMVLMGKPNVSDFFPGLAMFDLQGIERKVKRIVQYTESILDSAIEKRMNSNTGKNEGTGQMEQRRDFLQLLLELREQGGAGAATSISMRQVKAMLTVCPTFYFVACSPLI